MGGLKPLSTTSNEQRVVTFLTGADFVFHVGNILMQLHAVNQFSSLHQVTISPFVIKIWAEGWIVMKNIYSQAKNCAYQHNTSSGSLIRELYWLVTDWSGLTLVIIKQNESIRLNINYWEYFTYLKLHGKQFIHISTMLNCTTLILTLKIFRI